MEKIYTKEEALEELNSTIKKLKKNYGVNRRTEEDDLKLSNEPAFEIGGRVPDNPTPDDISLANELLKNLYGAFFEAQCKYMFLSKYGSWSLKAIITEIETIETFIEKSLLISYSEAADNLHYSQAFESKKEMFEFVRLQNGYYETKMFDPAVRIKYEVYGRYFRFYKFLIEKLPIESNSELLSKKASIEKIAPTVYYSLDELFIDDEHLKKGYNVLIAAQLIDDKYKYIGKNKGAISLWFTFLKSLSYFKEIPNDNIVTSLLNKKFENLKTSFDTVRKSPGVPTISHYRPIFKKSIK